MAQGKRTSNITVDGVGVAIERKRIQNVYLRVLPPDGRVGVSAPLTTTDATIETFVRSRMDWVLRRRALYAGYRPRAYESGEAVPYFGETLTLEVAVRDGRTHVERRGERLLLSIRPGSDQDARKRALDAYLRAALLAEARLLLPACERTVGRSAGELRVRDMKSRWGSCNVRTGDITLSLRLAEKPRACLHYVLTHELCHLRVPGHGSEFWRLMDGFYPDWKRTRRMLRG